MDSADALADFHQLQSPDLTYAYMTSNPFAIWAQAEFPYYSDMQDSSSTTFPVFLMCTSTPLTRFPSSWCRLPVLATLLTHPVSHLAPLRTLSLLHLLSSRRT